MKANESIVTIPPGRPMLFLPAVTGGEGVLLINFTLKAKDGTVIKDYGTFAGNKTDQPTTDSAPWPLFEGGGKEEQFMTVSFTPVDLVKHPLSDFEIETRTLAKGITAIAFQKKSGDEHVAFVYAHVW
jgi:hypothetical protein